MLNTTQLQTLACDSARSKRHRLHCATLVECSCGCRGSVEFHVYTPESLRANPPRFPNVILN